MVDPDAPPEPPGTETTRRGWLSATLMGVGLVASYGTLAAQGLFFILPKRIAARTRRLFVGPVDRFAVGEVQTIHDPSGNEILVKRNAEGFSAFSSTCPHLGCKVHWLPDEQKFFCPCHRGEFDSDGKGIAGPPGEAGQRLARAPLIVDEENHVVYLEVPDARRRV